MTQLWHTCTFGCCGGIGGSGGIGDSGGSDGSGGSGGYRTPNQAQPGNSLQ